MRMLTRSARVKLEAPLATMEKRITALTKLGFDEKRIHFAAQFGRNMEYYTGFVFELWSRDAEGPVQIAGGGRYDTLLRHMSAPRCSRRSGRRPPLDASNVLQRSATSCTDTFGVVAHDQIARNRKVRAMGLDHLIDSRAPCGQVLQQRVAPVGAYRVRFIQAALRPSVNVHLTHLPTKPVVPAWRTRSARGEPAFGDTLGSLLGEILMLSSSVGVGVGSCCGDGGGVPSRTWRHQVEILIINFSLEGMTESEYRKLLRRRRAGLRGGAGPRVQGLAGGSGERCVRRRLHVRERRGGGCLPGLGPVGAGGRDSGPGGHLGPPLRGAVGADGDHARSGDRDRVVPEWRLWIAGPQAPRSSDATSSCPCSSGSWRSTDLVCASCTGSRASGSRRCSRDSARSANGSGSASSRSTAGRSSRPSRGSWAVWPRRSTRRRRSPRQPTSPRSRAGRRTVVMIDTYEVFRLADPWLRHELLPALGPGVRVVVAGTRAADARVVGRARTARRSRSPPAGPTRRRQRADDRANRRVRGRPGRDRNRAGEPRAPVGVASRVGGAARRRRDAGSRRHVAGHRRAGRRVPSRPRRGRAPRVGCCCRPAAYHPRRARRDVGRRTRTTRSRR